MVCHSARSGGPPPSSSVFTINYYCITAINTTDYSYCCQHRSKTLTLAVGVGGLPYLQAQLTEKTNGSYQIHKSMSFSTGCHLLGVQL